MEEEKAPGAAPKAAPSRKAMWAIVAIIVAIAVAASGTVYFLASQPQYAKFTLVTLDFAYDQTTNPDVHPEHHAKVNQPVWVVMTNEGLNDHEFLLFKDKDTALVAANEDLAQALADHPNATKPNAPDYATEKQAALDEYDGLHDADARLVRYNDVDKDVAPDQTVDLIFVIHETGTYFFACHQVDTTDPLNWMIHQAHGMWGKLIVDP